MGQAFRVGPRSAWLIALVGLCGIAAFVALATRLGMLPLALGLVLVALVTVVGFRWPLLPLVIFAALIPLEEMVAIPGLGTISRFAGVLFAVTYGVPRLGHLALGAMPAAAWAYLAWAILSVGWAIDLDTASGELPTLIQLFLIALLVADFVVQRPTIVRPALWAYSLSAAATALLGIVYFVGLGSGVDVRAAAIETQSPAHFAAVLLPAVVFGLYELVNGERRVLGGAVAAITTIGVVVSGTRGAWVAVAIVVLFVILPQLRMRGRVALVAASLALVLLAYQVPGVSELLVERTGSAVSSGGAGRADIWSVGATIYQSAPVLGVGFANFPIAYTDDVVRASNVSSYTLSGAGPHNLVIGTLVELGPLGLTLLALFLGPLVIRRGWGPDGAVVQAALASLVTMALFLDIFGNRKQVWLVIGIAAGLAFLARRVRSASQAPVEADTGAGSPLGAGAAARPTDAVSTPAARG